MNKYIEVRNNPFAKAGNADFAFGGDLKILIVGNSFSRDSLFYLREIAAARGIDITMGLLYMGGRDFEYHYKTRTEEVNWFYINDFDYNTEPVSKNMSLKRVLDEFSRDYIAIQNFFECEYTKVSEKSYVYGAKLAEFIYSRRPDAALLINQIWSYEIGYSYESAVVDEKLQTETDGFIFENDYRLASYIKRRTGKTALIVPVGKAVAAVRRLDEFSACYYNDGFKKAWSDNRNGGKFYFGYGIISPEDAVRGRICLNRDGFHLSPAGRYLAAAVWFCILTGADARTLGFVPEKSVLGCWVTNGDEGYYLFGDFCRVDERYIGLLNNVVYNTLKGLNFYESDTCK